MDKAGIYFVYEKTADLGTDDVVTICVELREDGYMTCELSTSDCFTKAYFGDEVYEVAEGYCLSRIDAERKTI